MTEIGTRAKTRIGGRREVNLEESGVNFGMFSHLIFLCIASLGLLFNCPVPVTHSQSQCAVVQRKNKSSSTNRIAVCTCYFRFFSTRRVFCLRSRIFFHTPSALCWLAGHPYDTTTAEQQQQRESLVEMVILYACCYETKNECTNS